MQRINKEEIKNILIRMPDWVGTLVLATPVLKTVRNNFPQSNISAVVRSWSKPLLENCPYINEVIEYDSKNSSLIYQKEFVKKIKTKNFNLAIILPGSFNSALIPYLAGIKYRTGYSGDARSLLLTHHFRDENDKFFLFLLEKAGFSVDHSLLPELWISDSDKEFANNLWNKYNFTGKVIGIGPGVKGDKSRMWPTGNVIELIESLGKKYGIILFGSKDDVDLCETIENGSRCTVLNLAGKTTLNQFSALMQKCSLYVSNATGGMHIANIFTKVIGLFVPGDDLYWAPYGAETMVVKKEVKCSPCNPKRMKNCKNNICMKSITAKEVIDAVNRLI